VCGIVGYLGSRQAAGLLLDGLKNLEYRGYDSAGIAVLDGKRIAIRRCRGKVRELADTVRKNPVKGGLGVGHTRWATHGQPSEENAHPHADCRRNCVVVHNGIIENYLSLKRKLRKKGHRFRSQTDTEIIAHLIEEYYRPLRGKKGAAGKAVRRALGELEGSWALGVVFRDNPEKLIAARRGSPLVVGLGDDELFIASDIPAVLRHTRKVIHLQDGEIAVLTNGRRERSGSGVEIIDAAGRRVSRQPVHIHWNAEAARKGGFAHFMLKEIYEQPRAVQETFRGRISDDAGTVHLEEMRLTPAKMKAFRRIVITACGTSWHAGLVGEYIIEELAKTPTEVEYAAEFRYRDPLVDRSTLVIAISQSGETADTLAAVKEARRRGAYVISICNVVGSSITRESDAVILTHAGPEIGVASTKAFTTQLVVLLLFAVGLGRIKNTVSATKARELFTELRVLPKKIEDVLKKGREIVGVADRYYTRPNFLYLGRGKGFPIALEGALKLKEISYIHAEGYPAAEMKHGPIALIDRNMPVVVVALPGKRYEKILGNIAEIKARKGRVIAIAVRGDRRIKERVDDVIYIPPTPEDLTPVISVVPLQLLAYHIAVKRKCPVDQPRNLAKSVTVE
jgi:glucosamine--fructose-6-phosphate aminotransferase (isomerizing)